MNTYKSSRVSGYGTERENKVRLSKDYCGFVCKPHTTSWEMKQFRGGGMGLREKGRLG